MQGIYEGCVRRMEKRLVNLDKPVNCPFCSEKVEKGRDINIHIEANHANLKMYTCPDHPKLKLTKEGMTEHFRHNHLKADEKKVGQKHPCSMCPYGAGKLPDLEVVHFN